MRRIGCTDMQNLPASSQNLSFKGIGDEFWRGYKKLANYMKSSSEVVNASVDAFGTGVIATAIIPISPGKGDKEDKDKKRLQAFRQPISALLKLAFQVPVTILVWKGVDKLAYEKKIKMFKDDVIGDLIPSCRYIEKNLTTEEINNLVTQYDQENSTLREKHINEIKEAYISEGKNITNEELEKELQKGKDSFIRQECAKAKKEELIRNLQINVSNIKDEDLISDSVQKYVENAETDYAKRAREAIKERLEEAKKEADLKWYEKLGIKTDKVKAYKDKCNKIKNEEYLTCLRNSNPNLFSDPDARIKWYKENKVAEAQRRYSGKKFWISLAVNLVMSAASCYALNWLHPRIMELVDKNRNKKDGQNQNIAKKVEVKA